MRLKNMVNFLFTQEDIERIQVRNCGGIMQITVDVHRMSRINALRLIKNIIAISPNAFCLCVIHGYNHGTEIMQMLSDIDPKKISQRINGRSREPWNHGITWFSVAADIRRASEEILEFGNSKNWSRLYAAKYKTAAA